MLSFLFVFQNISATAYVEASKARVAQYEAEVGMVTNTNLQNLKENEINGL